jgi:hypothetical protein
MQFHIDPEAGPDEKIAVMATVLLDMHGRLFGNGQPGAIDQIEDRVGVLEKWREVVNGAWMATAKIGAFIVGLGAVAGVVYAIVKGK